MKSILLLLITLLAVPQEKLHKDKLDRAFIYPQRVVWTSSATAVKGSEVLLEEGNGQVPSPSGRHCRMQNRGDDKASIILDYGRELHGGLKLCLRWGHRYPSLVRIRFGESVGETCSEPVDTAWLMGHSTNDHAMRDYVMKVPRDGSIEIGNTGFRFVRIDVLEPDGIVAIQEAPAILRYRDIPYVGSFRCSDERLDRIWQTGAYTVHLNMQEYLWDGIKRDRLVWAGDMGTEIRTIAAVFGAHPIVPDSLALVLGQTPRGQWMNGLSSYTLWWIMEVCDWFMFTGDRAWLEKQREILLNQIRLVWDAVAMDGRENLVSGRYLDWPSSENPKAVHAGLQGLMILAMQCASKLFMFLGEDMAARRCRETEQLLRRHVPELSGYKQADALLALSGLRDAGEMAEMLARGGAAGFSSFLSCFTLGAMARGNRIKEALDCIREYWGGMLKMGATSFWEDFDISWMENAFPIDGMPVPGKKDIHGDFGRACYVMFRHSLCHGWAASPVPFLTEHVAGIRVLEPGFSRVSITPALGDLEWIRCECPTPHGILSVEAERRNGADMVRVHAPEGVSLDS